MWSTCSVAVGAGPLIVLILVLKMAQILTDFVNSYIQHCDTDILDIF